jgi:ribosomal protein S18 acetylase RimI-like enzyme
LADRVTLVQALPEPRETWATSALEHAGFLSVGRLLYLRRPATPQPFESRFPAVPVWPAGVDVVRVDQFTDAAARDRALVEALDRSYEATLDCPELCGLRRTEDILASHRGTGRYDPSLWWVVLAQGVPHGCMLLSRCPETATMELVYLGLSPALRGRRIGAGLLALGIRAACAPGPEGLRGSVDIACAVDRRNAPALGLYERAGFRPFAERVAMVAPTKPRDGW